MRTSHRALSLAVVLSLACLGPAARGENREADGLVVSVPKNLESQNVQAIQQTIEKAVQANAARPEPRPELKIVLDFNPHDEPASSKHFGACLDLARSLLNLKTTKTIALVHAPVTGHTVLPVLACQEVVLSENASVGPVLHGGEVLEESFRANYKIIADGQQRSWAPVLKMLDPAAEVYDATRNDAVVYLTREEAEQFRGKTGYQVPQQPALRAGATQSYPAREAIRYTLATQILPDLKQLLAAYSLPPQLRPDVLAGREPIAWLIKTGAPLTAGHVESLKRKISKAIGHRARPANMIILQVECGGSDQDSIDEANALARYLRELKEDRYQVKTVAWVPDRAPDAGTILALACDEIVMSQNGELGDFSRVAGNRGLKDLLVAQAEKDGGPITPLLIRGLFEKDLTIQEVSKVDGSHRSVFVTPDDLARLKQGPDKWQPPKDFKYPNGLLKITADRARDYKLVSDVIKAPTAEAGLAALYQKYGLKDVPVAEHDWLDGVVTFLQYPLVMFFLVMFGGFFLLWEFMYPGKILPGVVGALFFIVFFWSWWGYDNGGVMLLSVLLFLLGLVLIALEMFVFPGFGVAGVSGVLLVVISLALVAGGKWPQNSQETWDLVGKVGLFGGSIVGAGVGAMMLAWALPHIPYLNKLMLKAPHEQALEAGATLPELIGPGTAALLGAVGVADTPLRPAGRVRFGDEFVDVVAEGEYIMPGTQVQVIQVEGTRIVVKAI